MLTHRLNLTCPIKFRAIEPPASDSTTVQVIGVAAQLPGASNVICFGRDHDHAGKTIAAKN